MEEVEEEVNMLTKKEFEDLKKKEKILKAAAEILRVEDKDLIRVIERFKREIEEMKRSL